MSAKRHILTICAGAVALFNPLSLSAEKNAKDCTEEMLMIYFPEKYVTQTLNKFDVPQAQRSAIVAELAEKEHQFIPMVEERAGKMNPNPLKDPSMRQEAVKIFRDTLYELFGQVMQNHGVNDKEQIKAMLDDVQHQKAIAFAACMEQVQMDQEKNSDSPKKATPTKSQPDAPSDDNLDPEDVDQDTP